MIRMMNDYACHENGCYKLKANSLARLNGRYCFVELLFVALSYAIYRVFITELSKTEAKSQRQSVLKQNIAPFSANDHILSSTKEKLNKWHFQSDNLTEPNLFKNNQMPMCSPPSTQFTTNLFIYDISIEFIKLNRMNEAIMMKVRHYLLNELHWFTEFIFFSKFWIRLKFHTNEFFRFGFYSVWSPKTFSFIHCFFCSFWHRFIAIEA